MFVEFNNKTYKITAIDKFEFNKTDIKITAAEIQPLPFDSEEWNDEISGANATEDVLYVKQ
jgi:hypothetical protein